MNLLLAVETSQIILLVALLGLIVAYVFMRYMSSKKEQARFKNLTDTLKKGDKVITYNGTVGKIVEIQDKNGMKLVTIETGSGNYIGYTTLDIGAIGALLNENGAMVDVAKTPAPENDADKKVIEPTEEQTIEVETENASSIDEKTIVRGERKTNLVNAKTKQDAVKKSKSTNKSKKK